MRPFLTLHHPKRSQSYYAEGTWRDETLYDLLARHAGQRPHQPAARDAQRSVTWGELLSWVEAVAARFQALGLSAGDRVSVWMGNRLEVLVTALACSREGLACNPSLHRTFTSAEIGTLLATIGSSVLVTESGWGADRPADPVATFAGLPSLRAVLTRESFPSPNSSKGSEPVGDPDAVTYLAFTSGTTGLPKCVMHSSNTLLSNGRDLVRDWGHDETTSILSLSPLSHHIAWVGVAQWLLCGGRFACGEIGRGGSRLDWIVETGADYVLGVPTHAMDILAERQARGLPGLGDVRVFYMAGAPIPPVVAEDFVQLGIRPQNIYGMTENSSHQYTHPGDGPTIALNTCGRGGSAYEVAVFDPADRDRRVPPGVAGEIGGRGAALMLGYFNNQNATDGSFNRGGWFMSGDLGRMDDHGNLEILGRSKDLVIRGGHNIHPADIEARAVRNDRIMSASAFGVADERLGERVCLAVISDLSPAAIVAHLEAEGLSRFDMPEHILIMEEFPLTASGKVLKREIQARVARGELSPVSVRP